MGGIAKVLGQLVVSQPPDGVRGYADRYYYDTQPDHPLYGLHPREGRAGRSEKGLPKGPQDWLDLLQGRPQRSQPPPRQQLYDVPRPVTEQKL